MMMLGRLQFTHTSEGSRPRAPLTLHGDDFVTGWEEHNSYFYIESGLETQVIDHSKQDQFERIRLWEDNGDITHLYPL